MGNSPSYVTELDGTVVGWVNSFGYWPIPVSAPTVDFKAYASDCLLSNDLVYCVAGSVLQKGKKSDTSYKVLFVHRSGNRFYTSLVTLEDKESTGVEAIKRLVKNQLPTSYSLVEENGWCALICHKHVTKIGGNYQVGSQNIVRKVSVDFSRPGCRAKTLKLPCSGHQEWAQVNTTLTTNVNAATKISV